MNALQAASGALLAIVSAAALAAAPERGAQVYERCAACHSIEGNRTGPQHCGLFGRRAGTAPGYDGYSRALRESNVVWNERTLDAFLRDPMQAVSGTTMGYAGVKDAAERGALIVWLREATRAGSACHPRR